MGGLGWPAARHLSCGVRRLTQAGLVRGNACIQGSPAKEVSCPEESLAAAEFWAEVERVSEARDFRSDFNEDVPDLPPPVFSPC